MDTFIHVRAAMGAEDYLYSPQGVQGSQARGGKLDQCYTTTLATD